MEELLEDLKDIPETYQLIVIGIAIVVLVGICFYLGLW